MASSGGSSDFTYDSELRNLSSLHVHKLSSILSVDEQWAEVMGAVRWEEDGTGDKRRFTAAEVK